MQRPHGYLARTQRGRLLLSAIRQAFQIRPAGCDHQQLGCRPAPESSSCMFQEHHILPQKFATHPVIRLLGERFNLDAIRNLITLPSRQRLATELNSSPHTGGHLETYYKGFCEHLKELKASPSFDAAGAGDARALDEVASDVNALVAAAKYALANGHLFPNTPKGMTADQANDTNDRWFSNWRKYAADNAEQIRQMQETVDQFYNAGQRNAALDFPILSPTSDLSMAERIEILKRFPKGSPISLQSTVVGPVPGLQGLIPSLVDTRLRGFSPPARSDQDEKEGFTQSDPRFTGVVPPFSAPGPNEQQFGQLPPTTAAPSDPLLLRFDPMTGAPLPFYENPLMRDASGNGSSLAQDILPWLAGGAAVGIAAPFVPAWLAAILVGLAVTSRVANAQEPSSGAARDTATDNGRVFSTGAPAYNAFINESMAGNTTSNSASMSPMPGSPPSQRAPLAQDAASGGSFSDRFGNRTEMPVGTGPAAASISPAAPPTHAANAVPPPEVRRLTRVNASNAGSVFTSGSAPVPYLPSDRFGNWTVPTADGRPPQTGGPIGELANEPSYLIPPPIFGADDPGNARNEAEEWFSRWIRPFLRPE